MTQDKHSILPDRIRQAMSTMSMPLSPDSYQPLYYKSLPEMARIRSDVPDMPDMADMVLLGDVIAAIDCLRGEHAKDSVYEYLARCGTALLLLGHAGTDEAHDLVSPLSWPNELPFAYGPPVAVPEQVLTLASYVHALVHRREGPFPSEFGMTGFSNADYWAGSALRSPEGAEALPLEDIRQAILDVAQQSPHASQPEVQQWVQTNVAGEDVMVFPAWDPRVLNELCRTIQQANNDPASSNNAAAAPLRAFAEQAVMVEIQMLLKHTLRAMHYDI